MSDLHPDPQFSVFMASHLPDFSSQFGINFCVDGPQLEYFVYKKVTGQDISCSLTVNFDQARSQINVMTFYPGLWQHPRTHFFSAVCFFMVLNHFANYHQITSDCRITLTTRKKVFVNFYSLLKDFDFHVLLICPDGRVEIGSCFSPLGIDTSMLIERELVV